MGYRDIVNKLTEALGLKTKPAVVSEKLSEGSRNIPKIEHVGGAVLKNFRSEKAATSEIARIAQRDGRVQITVRDTNYSKSNGQANLYTGGRMKPNGVSAKFLLDQMEKAGMGLDDILRQHHTSSSCGPLPEIEDIELYTIREL